MMEEAITNLNYKAPYLLVQLASKFKLYTKLTGEVEFIFLKSFNIDSEFLAADLI